MNPKRIDPLLAQRLAEARTRAASMPQVTSRSATPARSPEPEPPYAVFIRTRHPLSAEELTRLQAVVGADAPAGRTTYTATLSREAIESLSECDWVFRISGSQPLNPLDPGTDA